MTMTSERAEVDLDEYDLYVRWRRTDEACPNVTCTLDRNRGLHFMNDAGHCLTAAHLRSLLAEAENHADKGYGRWTNGMSTRVRHAISGAYTLRDLIGLTNDAVGPGSSGRETTA